MKIKLCVSLLTCAAWSLSAFGGNGSTVQRKIEAPPRDIATIKKALKEDKKIILDNQTIDPESLRGSTTRYLLKAKGSDGTCQEIDIRIVEPAPSKATPSPSK
ncbi:hypothetical protein [Pseudobacteriovorax antillogorgiicola]|uniref:Uncharacterized protein n=1 Tax=Pseudobacteriovorax antillogorgiicola TaxID=1513793 RepID=A0A1Y6CL67_9BACT|nr:hypothetical protein [Pseudobacteriovorax antillogorgiicola]TCS47287.1 hypothetical protein EDD56_12162 [Pseudobacteriovorax antillogorgiicola]SMF62345.1 hypothetical protein SAMN06296036_12162 [Pseudobacteriovorax antillogorgiicola]